MDAARVVVSADGKTLFLLLFDEGSTELDDVRHVAVGLDVATGQLRWQWDTPRYVPHNPVDDRLRTDPRTPPAVAGDVVALSRACLLPEDRACGFLNAYDMRSGKPRWTWHARGDGPDCVLTQSADGGQQIVVVEDCATSARVIALSADTGAVRWSWQRPAPPWHL